jgi:ribonuclease P protein component
MLNKNNRLRKTKEIEAVLKSKKSFYSDFFGVKAIKNNLEINRIVIIISAKVSKKAVDRNKIKRRIKAIFIEENKKMTQGYDCIIILNKDISKKTFLEIKDLFIYSFNKIGLL